MATGDIRVAVSFKGHRKRRKLRRILGERSTDYLLDLWISTAQNHPDGVLSDMDELDIAMEAGWDGGPEEFVKALVDCGFIEADGGAGYRLHDWLEHQPFVAGKEARSAQARKAAEVRWEAERRRREEAKRLSGGVEREPDKVPEMPDECSEHADSMQNAMPLPTYLPTTDSLELDLCEDLMPGERKLVSSKPPGGSEPPIILFPVVNPIGEAPIFQSDIDNWAELFPGLDILQRLRRCRQYSLDNPKRRKTRVGLHRHITTWLEKDQNQGVYADKPKTIAPKKRRYVE